MNQKLQTNGALLVGPVVRPGDIVTGETLVSIPTNLSLFMALAKRYRVRRHSDGWFVDGARHVSQIWEYGDGKLGLTVVGRRFVRKCMAESSWLTPKSVGDDEANLYCDWTDENLGRLNALVKLQIRKKPVHKQDNGGAI